MPVSFPVFIITRKRTGSAVRFLGFASIIMMQWKYIIVFSFRKLCTHSIMKDTEVHNYENIRFIWIYQEEVQAVYDPDRQGKGS